MATTARRGERRPDALSKERIVSAATEILDAGGEGALTFRALAARLSTGPGAIYWHVADKGELLAETTRELVEHALDAPVGPLPPREAIRATALAVFDVIDAHPWVGAQLSQEPWQLAATLVFERFGQEVGALGVPEPKRFDCASALLNYVSGLAGQYASATRLANAAPSREDFLSRIADQWRQRDPEEFPFLRAIAAQLADHDDREQFIAGIDLVLVGIDSLR